MSAGVHIPKTAVNSHMRSKLSWDIACWMQKKQQDPECGDSEPAVLPAEADRTESGPAACTSHLVHST